MRKRTSLCRQRRIAVGLVGVGLLVRGWSLSSPDVLVFDEIFYANDALDMVTSGVEQSPPRHPPLGKWVIGIGIRLFGFTPFGWRAASLLAGVALVGLVVIVTARLTRSAWLGGLAGSLCLIDGIAFITGRLALLDGFAALWILAAVSATLRAAKRPHSAASMVLAGALAGAAVATKWTAAPLLPVLVVAAAARRGSSARQRTAAASAVLASGLAVYALSYSPWLFTGVPDWACERTRSCEGPSAVVTAVVDLQSDNVEFHRSLVPRNRYAAPGWTWATQRSGVVLYEEPCDASTRDCTRPGGARLVAQGNPVIWMSGTAACGWLLVHGIRRRRSDFLIVASAAASLWLPWILLKRNAYAFYGIAVLPLLTIAVAALISLLSRRIQLVSSCVLLTAAIGVFAAQVDDLLGF